MQLRKYGINEGSYCGGGGLSVSVFTILPIPLAYWLTVWATLWWKIVVHWVFTQPEWLSRYFSSRFAATPVDWRIWLNWQLSTSLLNNIFHHDAILKCIFGGSVGSKMCRVLWSVACVFLAQYRRVTDERRTDRRPGRANIGRVCIVNYADAL